MMSGQRNPRKMRSVESQGFSALGADDYDDYGVPSVPQSRGSGGNSKKGFFGRLRRGSNANIPVSNDDSDDEGGTFDVIPGLPPAINHLSDQYQGSHSSLAMHQDHPYGSEGPGQVMASDTSIRSRASNGDISMDQISSLRDRHRYPGMLDDPNSGARAMSLTSMSNYDTTPIIPTLGVAQNFNGSTRPVQNQDKYRQRMIESRRALMSSESGVPIRPAAQPAGDSSSVLGSRTMSMGSMHNQLSGNPQGRGQSGFSARSNTMNSQLALSPPQVYSQAQPGYRGPPQHGTGLGVNMGEPGFRQTPQGYFPVSGAPAMGVPAMGGPAMGGPVAGGPVMGGPTGSSMPGPMSHPQHYRQQSQQSFQQYPQNPQQMHMQPHPQMHYLQNQNPQVNHGASLAPPVATPQLNGYSPMAPSPGMRSEVNTPRISQGPQPPQVGLQKDINESHEFDFGNTTSLTASRSNSLDEGTKKTEYVSEEMYSELENLKNEVRVLSIELAESVRRELSLPSGSSDSSESQAATANALAKTHSLLSLERAKRSALEKAAQGKDDTVDVKIKLAELECKHSEAVHLLSIRTDQYDSLKKRFASLDRDHKNQHRENIEKMEQNKEREVSQHLYKQDEELKTKMTTLEAENKGLREKLDQFSSRGPLNERVTSLEDQRSALQEALRAMRERKDAEIRALTNRVEMLSSNQRAISSGSIVTNSAGVRVPSAPSMLQLHGSKSSSPVGNGMDESPLSLPRMRNSSLSRPASPLHLGLDYNR